jgi:hypothetical protein
VANIVSFPPIEKESIFAYHTVAYAKLEIVNPFQKSTSERKASDSSKPKIVLP